MISNRKVAFVLVCGLVLAACTTPAPAAAPVVEPPAATKTPVVLTMLFAQSLLGGVEGEIIAEFSKIHPEVTFKVEAVPDGGYFDLLRANMTTGNMADLFQDNIGHVSTALVDEAGFMFDLAGMESLKLYHPSLVEASKFNGKVVNFSLGVGVLGFPYNKAVLAKYGYSKPFSSWQEMMEAGAKLKKDGKDLLVYSSKWETAMPNVFHWTFGNRALKDADFKKAYLSNTIDWTTPGYRDILVEGFGRFKELNEFVRTGSFTNEYAAAQQAFTNGEAAIVMGGTWEAGSIRKLNPEIDLGFMNLPYSPEAENAYIFVPEDGVALNSKSPNLETAKVFLNFLFNKENYAKIQKSKGSMSAEVGVGELDASYADVPNWLATTRVMPFSNTGPVFSPAWVELGSAAQQYTFDGDLDAAIDRFIEAYKKKLK